MDVKHDINWVERYGDPAPLDQLTIIIFTRDRFDYVAQQIRQWKGLPAKFLIFINGTTDVDVATRAALPNNVTCHFEKDSYHTQMTSAGEWIDTPFCMIADDDDILSPFGLRAATSVLANDPQVETVAPIRGSLIEGAGEVVLRTTVPSAGSRLGNLYRIPSANGHLTVPLSNSESSSLERSVFQLGAPWRGQGWYAVHRTTFMKWALPILSKLDAASTCRSAAEVAMELLTAWSGNIRFLPLTAQFRRDRNPSVLSDSSHRWLSYHAWSGSRRYSSEYETFVETLLSCLPFDQNEDRECVQAALRSTARDDMRGRWFNYSYSLASIFLRPTSMSQIKKRIRDSRYPETAREALEFESLRVRIDSESLSTCVDAEWIAAFLKYDHANGLESGVDSIGLL